MNHECYTLRKDIALRQQWEGLSQDDIVDSFSKNKIWLKKPDVCGYKSLVKFS